LEKQTLHKARLEKASMLGNRKTLGEKPKEGVAAATIATYGEVFHDGSQIELIGGNRDRNPRLLLWDGLKETIGVRIQHQGQLYEPAPIDRTILQELVLPTRCCPHGSTRELLAEICKLIANLVGLPEKPSSLVGRIVLDSALIDAVYVAPALMIVGPDITRGNRLVALMRCLCRRSLLLTGVTPAGFCSLPTGARFTYIISQSSISDVLRKLLDDASSRDRRIPFRGGLLDHFGLQVIHSDSFFAGDSWPTRSIPIPMIPTGQELPVFDLDAHDEITTEFQAKLVSFRRANLGAARRLQFDASKFAFALRDLARSVAGATPDDPELQAELFDLLREEDSECRSGRWIDLSTITIEAVLFACRESPGGMIYVSDLAEIAQQILRRRGEESKVDPGVFGKRMKFLGFTSEPRDAKGKKLRLTDAVCSRAELLAHDFGSPEVGVAGLVEVSQRGKEG
jgi:hypothetical protein